MSTSSGGGSAPAGPGGAPTGGTSRAFAQKLAKHQAGEIRRQAAAELKAGKAAAAGSRGGGVAGGPDTGLAPSSAAHHHLLATQIGSTSVQYSRHHRQHHHLLNHPTSAPNLAAIAGGIHHPTPPPPQPPPPPPPSASSSTSAFQQQQHHPSSASLLSTATASPSLSFHVGGDYSSSTSVAEPIDYEDFVNQQHRSGDRDPLAHALEFPADDLEVKVVPRKVRTMGHILPEEPMEKLDPNVQSCVECYTSDFVVVRRKHQQFSSSAKSRNPAEEEEERLRFLDATPAHEFEVDDAPDDEDYGHLLRDPRDLEGPSKLRHWRRSLNAVAREQMSMPNSLGGSLRSLDSVHLLPRSCSATSVLDLGSFKIGGGSTLSINLSFDDDAKTICPGEEDEEETDGDCTPTNAGSPTSLKRSDTITSIDSNKLSEMLEAMSTPQVLRGSKRNSSDRRNANSADRNNGDTPRGSWATFDLRNSQPDAAIPGLLDHVDAETVDHLNEVRRGDGRIERILGLCTPQLEAECVERRPKAEEPMEPRARHRILVQCNKLELSLQVEPIFASMSLYDAKEKKKVSENFYFDLNPDQIRRMLEGYVPQADYSTQARSCMFEVSQSTQDLFLVVKLEKVLQGDIAEAAEPYLKEANVEKVRAAAYDACNRLGKYRMPFAWTAIWMQNIVKGREGGGGSDGSDVESTASNSLDRKSSTASFEHFRRQQDQHKGGTVTSNMASLTRKGSLERKDHTKRSSWAAGGGVGWVDDPLGAATSTESSSQLDSFPPVTLTVSSFFKQEGDKLKDEDLYKFLLDLKRPSTALKRLKCIRGTLKLDISVAPEQTKYCFSPELVKIIPFPDMKSRPCKEILEFPARESLQPNYHFRNLLYVCPKDLNFANRSGERARNIAIKMQLMGEDDTQGLKAIYGKSSCPEFTAESYSAVTYHNKTPDFYEEVKIKLPSNLRERHHILFTFYHISCQGQRKEQISTEVPVGYTWIPIFRNGSLQTGLFELPVMLDPPSPALRYVATDSGGAPPGTKWVEGKKPVFSVELTAYTSVHPLDGHLDRFLDLTATLQLGNSTSNERTTEDELLKRMADLPKARLEPLARFLPLVLDKLLLLMVRPPSVSGHVLNVAQAAFNAIAAVVNKISSSNELSHLNDRHGRNALLASYTHYQAHLPHPDFGQQGSSASARPKSAPAKGHNTSSAGSSGISLLADDEVGSIIMKGQHPGKEASDMSFAAFAGGAGAKLVHEQLALQWSMCAGPTREAALAAGWFFLELMTKAMVEHLATTGRLGAPRRDRFSDQFHDDALSLVAKLTSDIVCRHKEAPDVVEKLNSALAFFLHDLLSIMDRGFAFSLIRTYMRDVSSRMTNSSETLPLWHLQLSFLRIVCSHEHFISLSLPSVNPTAPIGSAAYLGGGGGAASPSPSIRSNDSQNSFITLPGGGGGSAHSSHPGGLSDRPFWADLNSDFRRRHFLVGLVLSSLSKSFEQSNPEVHTRSVNLVRNLLTCHDSDTRFLSRECRARVSSLYLPLVTVTLDNLDKLYSWSAEGETRIAGTVNPNEHLNLILTAISDNVPNAKGPIILKEDTTRHLLSCVLWVLKNTERPLLRLWWSELSTPRLQTMLEILRICVSCFQYKGKRAIRKHATLGARRSHDVRSRLEDMILGSGPAARSSRKDRSSAAAPPSPNPSDYSATASAASTLGTASGRRWQKTSFLRSALGPTSSSSSAAATLNTDGGGSDSLGGHYHHHGVGGTGQRIVDPETEAHFDGLLSAETSMVVLDTLETIVQVVSQSDHGSTGLLASVLRVLLHALGTNQSAYFLRHLFAVQRSFVFKFPSLLFDEASEHCADLCLRLLRHCSSSLSSVRSQASASLYLLMRQNFEIGNNFARVKMQVTMSLSKLVGTMSNFNEEYLRKSLKTILVYAEQDQELSDTSFPEQVQDLVFNLHMILSDTVKMKEYIDDPEMHMDLMYRIAKGYQNSPDLRLTWLESMATKHEQYGHYAEAGMCKIHCAALISEYLHMLEDRKYMPTGAVTFSKLTPNSLEESAVSDDVVSPDEEGICTGKNFTENGLISLLDRAAKCFSQAGMYEAMNEVYKASLPVVENARNFKKLAEIHGDLHEAFKNVHRLQGKRIFGTYFRVGFYGARFGDLDGEEYIYKEKALAKLPEIAHRLENFYGDKFGKDNVVIIKDSKTVEPTKLSSDKAYIQITYVEPFFDSYELRERKTVFEKNFNIIRFIFSTPFTPDGNPHGDLHEQYKRKTILTASNHFPYVKTRIQVVDRKQIVLTPIEVAIEDIQKKTDELETATLQEPPDPKILQMVLQGCIGTTVNQGPLEVANVFLGGHFNALKEGVLFHPDKHQNKLRLCFKDFDKKCLDALRRNKKLISADQKEYQRELEKNYDRFHKHMSPLFTGGGGVAHWNNVDGSGRPGQGGDQNESKVTSPMV